MKLEQPTYWRFVEKYYPNYYSSDKIARSNDLDVILAEEDEEDSTARKLVYEEYAGDHYNPHIELDAKSLELEILQTAIEAYLVSKDNC